jgi:hypothetical protein
VLLGHKLPSQDLKAVKQIYNVVEGRDKRNELNLYISGYDDEEEHPEHAAHDDSPTPLVSPEAPPEEPESQPEAEETEAAEEPPEPPSESETS